MFGECGYTAFVRSLCKDRSLVDIACHEKGMFVVQKMVCRLRHFPRSSAEIGMHACHWRAQPLQQFCLIQFS